MLTELRWLSSQYETGNYSLLHVIVSHARNHVTTNRLYVNRKN